MFLCVQICSQTDVSAVSKVSAVVCSKARLLQGHLRFWVWWYKGRGCCLCGSIWSWGHVAWSLPNKVQVLCFDHLNHTPDTWNLSRSVKGQTCSERYFTAPTNTLQGWHPTLLVWNSLSVRQSIWRPLRMLTRSLTVLDLGTMDYTLFSVQTDSNFSLSADITTLRQTEIVENWHFSPADKQLVQSLSNHSSPLQTPL